MKLTMGHAKCRSAPAVALRAVSRRSERVLNSLKVAEMPPPHSGRGRPRQTPAERGRKPKGGWMQRTRAASFGLCEWRQIKTQIYSTRTQAKSEIFDYIEGLYNPVRRHKHLDQLSPHEFERQRKTSL